MQRKKTLLKEYEQSGKSSVFLDKRIGAQNELLGEFDKAIMRSQRERQVSWIRKVLLCNLKFFLLVFFNFYNVIVSCFYVCVRPVFFFFFSHQWQLKLSKKSKYNLSDGEEDELEIQGGLFPEKDDFDDEIPFDGDEDVDDGSTGNGSMYIILSGLQMHALYKCM